MKFGFCSLSCCKGSEHKKRCFVSSLRHVFVPAPSHSAHVPGWLTQGNGAAEEKGCGKCSLPAKDGAGENQGESDVM